MAIQRRKIAKAEAMQEVVSGVTEQQKDMLLRGLRFVRSSVMLGMSNPSAESSEARSKDLKQVDALIAQLNGASAT